MSDRIVIEQGSPTLAGLKPASMFSVFFDGTVGDFYREVRRINRILVPKGMRFVPLCIVGTFTNIFPRSPEGSGRRRRFRMRSACL